MHNLGFILLVFSFVFAVIAALFQPVVLSAPLVRIHFGWLAFVFYIASLIFGR